MALFNITFTKVFVDGTLEGITYNDTLKGASEKCVETMRRREREGSIVTPCVGGSKYRITNVVVMERFLVL
jgi:hypothetical protein